MYKWGIWGLIAIVFFLGTLSANQAEAGSTQTDFPIAVVCTSTGQLCDPPFSVNVETHSELSVKYTVIGHCSSVRVHVLLDGERVATSEFLGWVGSPPPPFDVLPLMTPVFDLGPVSPGVHEVGIQAEGQVSGCNSVGVGRWEGTLTTFTNEAPIPDIHNDILTEVQNIEKKLDGDRPSLITQIVDTLTSIATDIGQILSIIEDDETGIGSQAEKLDDIEEKLEELAQANQENTILMALKGFDGISENDVFQINSIQHHVGTVDNLGNIKVKADSRAKVCEGKKDDNSSCWIRVAAPYSSQLWGNFLVPRTGDEVAVSFIEGDPDRPLIISTVYNQVNMPAYDLQMNIDRTPETRLFMSYGFNEIIIDDQKGEESICVQVDPQKNTVVECSSDLSFATTPECDDLGGTCKAWAACVNSGDQILSWSACPNSHAVCCGPPRP